LAHLPGFASPAHWHIKCFRIFIFAKARVASHAAIRRTEHRAPPSANTGLDCRENIMAHYEHQSCIEACVRCAEECEHCGAACLDEQDVAKMAQCIRLDRDCAEICWTSAAFMSRGSRFAEEICRVCAELCEACGAECRKHKAEHCQRCAEACEACAEECRQMAGAGTR
jgi:Domain of Unknown Function (DUF326)